MKRLARIVAMLSAFLIGAPAIAPALAADGPVTVAAAPLTLTGTVVDAASGLPLAGVTLTSNGPAVKSTTTARNGSFSMSALPAGLYTLTAELSGYQTAVSSSVAVSTGASPNLTLSLQRVVIQGNNLRTIATTSTTAAQSLQRSTVIYQSIDPENVINQGVYRIGDALIQLPGINDSASQTAAPADDMTISFRGFGNLETATMIDDHPIAYGSSSGYNFEISPPYAFRSVTAVYGTGASELYPISAIGGVVNMLTLAPTPKTQFSATQQFGTWAQLGTGLTATGPIGKLGGYAVAASAFGQQGPFWGLNLYNASASQDPGSPGYWQNTGQYAVGNATTTQTLLGKLVLNTNQSGGHLTLTALASSFYDDKTGNGDNDYLPYNVALQQAQNNLGGSYPVYSIGANPQPLVDGSGNPITATCPTGTLPLFNANGTPSGSYSTPANPTNPIGVPGTINSSSSGKIRGSANGTIVANSSCVTPQQYATAESGWQGAGPAFQTFNIGDYSAAYTTPVADGTFNFQAYSDNYKHHKDRSQQLPYFVEPGDNASGYTENFVNTGFSANILKENTNNAYGFGFWYDNDTYTDYDITTTLQQASTATDTALYFRDVYRVPNTPLTAYLNLWEKTFGTSHSSAFDPRLALTYALNNDVFRVSAGSTTTGPAIQTVNQPFIAGSPGSLLGNITCNPTTPNSIGSTGGGGSLKPEDGVGEEFGYGHRFGRDSILQLTFYNYNVYNYIASLTAPLTVTGIPTNLSPSQLQAFYGEVTAACGTSQDVNTLLGISGPVNIASLRARGINLSGAQRFLKHAIFSYNWDLNSTVPTSADQSYFANDGSLIQNAQLPGVPLHKWSAGLAYEFPQNVAVNLNYFNVEANNSKNLPTYGYWTGQANWTLGPGHLALACNNLFNQRADYRGLIGEGYPLPSNSYNGGAPIPTEQFSLPYRTLSLTFTLSSK
jgi:outer membrane receptor for ferrienterochelin and colicin